MGPSLADMLSTRLLDEIRDDPAVLPNMSPVQMWKVWQERNVPEAERVHEVIHEQDNFPAPCTRRLPFIPFSVLGSRGYAFHNFDGGPQGREGEIRVRESIVPVPKRAALIFRREGGFDFWFVASQSITINDEVVSPPSDSD